MPLSLAAEAQVKAGVAEFVIGQAARRVVARRPQAEGEPPHGQRGEQAQDARIITVSDGGAVGGQESEELAEGFLDMSASMFSTTATVGRRWRKLALNSHASATNISLLPMRVLPPMKSSDPPMWMEGSMPHSMSTWESMEVVVVLPWAPHTPMAVSNPSIS